MVDYDNYCEASDIPTVIIHNIAHNIFDYEYYCKTSFNKIIFGCIPRFQTEEI